MIGQTVASRGRFWVQEIILPGPERPEREYTNAILCLLISDLSRFGKAVEEEQKVYRLADRQ